MSEDFIHIDSKLPVAKVENMIADFTISHVVVSNNESGKYYLFEAQELLEAIVITGQRKEIGYFITYFEKPATPVVQTSDPVELIPPQAIIVDNGNLVGFYNLRFRDRNKTAESRNHNTRGATPHDYDTSSKDLDDLNTVYLNADFPQQTMVGTTISILVNLTKKAITSISLAIDLNKESKIDVYIEAKNGFEITGKNIFTLMVSDDDEGLPILFKAKATSKGQGKLRIYAFTDGIALGFLDLSILVLASQPADAGVAKRFAVTEQMVILQTPKPDLNIYITEITTNGGESSLTFIITAADPSLGLYLKNFGRVKLRTNPSKYFHDFFEEIENLPLETPGEKLIAQERLEAKGSQLFENLLPDELKELLWEHKEKIKTLKIDSEEPWIPWEVCKMSGTENGTVIEGDFFCEAFEITRWIPGNNAPNDTFNFSNIALVVPKDSGLPYSTHEKESIMSLSTGSHVVVDIPADYISIRSNLSKGHYSVWHFTGHGNFLNRDNPDKSTMILEREETFTPEDLSGKIRNLGKANPLVFLNACQLGRTSMGLTGIGGWASRFLNAGAAGFIGAYWEIYDKSAYDFAVNFYENLLCGLTVGKATLEARRSIKNSGDPTWLAYTVYADPYAKIKSK